MGAVASRSKAALEPLAQLVAGPLVWLWSEERTDEELAALADAARYPTQANVWWATYQAAELVRVEVPRIQANRAAAREVVTEPEESPYADDPGTAAPAKPETPPEADKTAPVAANSPTDGH